MGIQFREGTRPAWKVFVCTYLVAAVALAAYWMITESGPIGRLGRVQARVFDGEWFPSVTTVCVLLAMLVPLAGIRFAFEALTGKRLTGDGTS